MNVPHFSGAKSSHDHRSLIQTEEMAKRWGPYVEAARITLEDATNQRAVHNIRGTLGQRFKTSQQQLNHKQLATKFNSDTLFPRVTSLRGKTCAQLFCISDGYAKVYPMKLKYEAGSKLNELCSNVGIPYRLFTDNAGEETGGEWETARHKHLIPQGYTEHHTPWQKKAELEIGEEKAHYCRIMHRAQAPEALWDHGFEHTDEIRQNLARKNLGWLTPFEVLTGDTPDISDLLDFGYYDWVWYWDPTNLILANLVDGLVETIPMVLICYKILKPNGHWIVCSSCNPLSDSDKHDAAVKDRMASFTTKIDDIIGKFEPSFILEGKTAEFEALPPLDDTQHEKDLEPLDVDDEDTLDPLINAEIILPQGDGIALSSVMERNRAHDGSSIGRRNKNPLFDSRIYIVKLPDGEMKDVGYNILAEHIFSQMEKDGNHFRLFSGIIGHRRNDNAVDKEDQIRISDKRKVKKKTLSRWAFEVEWSDGRTTWIGLKNMKESNAIEVAEYALANQISHEPAFDWWVHHVIRRKKRLIKLSQTRLL
jgi:hypothetical protein